MFYAIATVTVLGLSIGLLMDAFSYQLLGIFVQSKEALDMGRSRLLVICSTYILCGIMDVMCAYLRGLEHPVTPTIITLFGACVLRLVFIFTIFQMIPEIHTLPWLYASFPISWCVVILIYIPFIVAISRRVFKIIELKNNIIGYRKADKIAINN